MVSLVPKGMMMKCTETIFVMFYNHNSLTPLYILVLTVFTSSIVCMCIIVFCVFVKSVLLLFN